MKNKLIDLNNHLFIQLERLNSENLRGDELKDELNRTKAVTSIAASIISNAALSLRATEFQHEIGDLNTSLPLMLESKKV